MPSAWGLRMGFTPRHATIEDASCKKIAAQNFLASMFEVAENHNRGAALSREKLGEKSHQGSEDKMVAPIFTSLSSTAGVLSKTYIYDGFGKLTTRSLPIHRMLRYAREPMSFSTPPIHSSIAAMSFGVTLGLFGS
jgi:hypothetical protein